MDQLQTYSKPELVLISETMKLRDYTPEQRTSKSANLVYKLLNLLGVNEGKAEHHTELVGHVTTFYGHFTFEQIEKAFGMFISRQLKTQPFQQLNAVVFGNVMQEFDDYQKEQTKVYRQNIQQFKLKAKPMSETEKDELMQTAITNAIIQYKRTGEIELAPSKYDWLDSKGKMQGNRTAAEWESIKKETYQSAKNRLIEVYSKAKASSTDERAEFKNIIIELQGAKSTKAINQSKYELLENYFNSLIS